jgi:hypothetical protein
MTMAACPDGSVEQHYLQLLARVVSGGLETKINFSLHRQDSIGLHVARIQQLLKAGGVQNAFCLAWNHQPHDDKSTNAGYSCSIGFATALYCFANS